MADADKTEDATAHKLEQAREKGDIPKSREFIHFFILFGASMSFYFSSQFFLEKVILTFKKFFAFQTLKLESTEDFINMGTSLIGDILILLAPLCLGILVFGIAAHLVQFGLLFTTEKLTPDLEKLDPIAGLRRMFSIDVVVELIKSSLKVLIISALFYLILRGEVERLIELGSQPLGQIFLYLLKLVGQVIFVMILFMAVLGISDFFYSRWRYANKMKMSVQEVKEEFKNREGDPLIRGRIRQMAREKARARMMEKVPTADVVVTNPTHVAVALQYRKGLMRAPLVVAKGAGYIALKIKEIAIQSEVPVLERRELARFLYRNVEVNESIPESLYTAVAEVLAYVYRVKKKFTQWKENHALT
jgi:flagellar biosynthetic protein FlhB